MEVVLRGEMFAQTCMTVLHYRVAATTDTPYNTVVDAMDDWFTAGNLPQYLACCAPEFDLVDISYQMVAPEPRFVKIVKDHATPGTNANHSRTADVCGVITKRTWHARGDTDEPGGQTGSIHVPALPDIWMEEGLLSDAALVDLDILGSKLINYQDTDPFTTWYACLWHRDLDPQPKSTDVVRYSVQPEVRVMRRRTVGRGI